MGCLNSKSSESKPLTNSKYSEGQFSKEYSMGEELGSGAFSIVRSCTKLSTKEKCAVKVIKKAKLKPVDETALRQVITCSVYLFTIFIVHSHRKSTFYNL